ncbi:MAG: AmmeMemoRadiSam system protein B [Candidatus Dadabacteria bacterium]|nr:MAG: AmmeMemoRadiSam system protein B [Candidatus Dadabacteria bacterium]
MKDPYQYPKLRSPLEANFQEIQGEQVLILRDPLAISESPLFLKGIVAPILALFDGNASVGDIVGRFKDQGLTKEMVHQLIALLDSSFMLQTEGFERERKRVEEEFKQAKVRKSHILAPMCGEDPEVLRRDIDAMLSVKGDEKAEAGDDFDPESLICVFSPHIDYRRGKGVYGVTYDIFRNAPPFDLFVVFGTCHQYSEGLFHLTTKDFETPLGLVKTDAEFVKDIASRCGGESPFKEEIVHRAEHSIELQLPFLKRIYDTVHGANFKIVPVLVGSFHRFLDSGASPSDSEEYSSFLTSLSSVLKERIEAGTKVCILGGIDLAHIGRSFGDTGSLNDKILGEVEEKDSALIDLILSCKVAEVLSHFRLDNNARRVCGFSSIYTALDLLKAIGVSGRGKLIRYEQAVDYSSDCAVTFAGIGIYGSV